MRAVPSRHSTFESLDPSRRSLPANGRLLAHPQERQRRSELRSKSTSTIAWIRRPRLSDVIYEGPEVTYNLTEPLHHSYLVEGIVVANCCRIHVCR